ncbi:MAG: FtsX-like permease family protein, partial [Lachnospiraceae bacterium]|nr:FtsX-like permease family protein [Lachnospiraceae bacterium]
ARHAANVSPVAAVTGSMETSKAVSHDANNRLFRVERDLGVYHAVSSKKNMTLMSLSFAFTVVLFLSFYALLDFANRLLPQEGELNPDISVAAVDSTNTIPRSMKDEMSSLPDVEAVFGCAIAYNIPALINGNEGSIDLVSYDEYMFRWTKNLVVSGSMNAIDGDTNNVLTIFNRDSRLDAGDKIKIMDTELDVVCVVSAGIGTEGRPALVCTEETFERITGEKDYMILNAQLTKDASKETVDKLRAIAGENEFADRREENKENASTFGIFQTAAYGFLAIIALITIFNIMNSISMSVSARIRQYGSMRAVGMSVRQMTKMIAAEAVAYAVCGLFIGCVGGLFLHRIIMNKLVYEHFGGAWEIPIEPLVTVTVIFALSCAAAVYAPAKRIGKMEITETISEL